MTDGHETAETGHTLPTPPPQHTALGGPAPQPAEGAPSADTVAPAGDAETGWSGPAGVSPPGLGDGSLLDDDAEPRGLGASPGRAEDAEADGTPAALAGDVAALDGSGDAGRAEAGELGATEPSGLADVVLPLGRADELGLSAPAGAPAETLAALTDSEAETAAGLEPETLTGSAAETLVGSEAAVDGGPRPRLVRRVVCSYRLGWLASDWLQTWRRLDRLLAAGGLDVEATLAPLEDLPPDTDILVIPPELRQAAREAALPNTPILVTPAAVAAGAFADLVGRLEAGTEFSAARTSDRGVTPA